MRPKVSICIPTYQQVDFLQRTLTSIAEQDFEDYEIIVSDDSSQIDVELLLRRFEFDGRLTYVRNSPALGSPANWNRVVALARGEYIKILHHDDWLAHPESLKRFVRLLDDHPEAGFAFSAATARLGDGSRTWLHRATPDQVDRLRKEATYPFLANIIGPPSATIVRRSDFVPYDEHLTWLVDIDQYIRILGRTAFAVTEAPLIVSTAQALHQVTRRCIDDRRVNVFEYFYLYEAIADRIPGPSRMPYIETLMGKIFTHGVTSLEDIRHCGYDGDMPEEIMDFLTAPAARQMWRRWRWWISRVAEAVGRRL